MTSNALLDAALACAERGVLIHPCRPNQKEPILGAWQKAATLDPGIIAPWWRPWPNANVGIVGGGPRGLLVVDVDPDKGGESSFAKLEADCGALPDTVESITPSGGRHLYLTVPLGRSMPGNSAGKLGPGIDTRGKGGYVLAPPSIVAGTRYEWSVDCADTFAEAPDWLLDALGQGGDHKAPTRPEEWLKIITEGVTEGARNTAVAKLAGLLFRYLPQEQAMIAAELVACWNETCCRPPLGAAELKRTLDSIATLEMKRRGLVQ